MKKTITRGAALLFAAMLCMSLCVFAKDADDTGITPYLTYIAGGSNNLTHEGGGKMLCEASTSTRSGYIAGLVTMELQQNNGGWNTIMSWDHSEKNYVYLGKNWYVAKGYAYRLKVTHKAYDTSWNELESYTSYSDIVYY